jgi:hypothetical protein
VGEWESGRVGEWESVEQEKSEMAMNRGSCGQSRSLGQRFRSDRESNGNQNGPRAVLADDILRGDPIRSRGAAVAKE